MDRRILADIEGYRLARRRVVRAALVSILVLGLGALGYWYLGLRHQPGLWSVADCVYMTAITVTTVGFAETIDVASVAGGREWTMLLLLFGISANLYVISSITSFFVGGDYAQIRGYTRDQRRMKKIQNHHVICGVGSTGAHVLAELLAVGEAVVVIDQSEEALAHVADPRVITICGDATDDEVLARAAIARAKGIVATLDDDKTNLYVVLTARQLSAKARIVAKAVSPAAAAKLRRAGADAVVSPNLIGGMRIASELVRPHVVKFLDDMLRDRGAGLRIEEAQVQDGGSLVGRTLRGADVRGATGALILAVRMSDGTVEHAPQSDLRFEPGQLLIAIGTGEQIRKLRELAGDRR